MERQEGRVSSTFRHVMPVDEGSEGAPETVMDLKRLRAHQRQALVESTRCAAWRPAACLLARPLADHGAHSVDAMARTEMWRVIGTCSTGAGALMQAH